MTAEEFKKQVLNKLEKDRKDLEEFDEPTNQHDVIDRYISIIGNMPT